MSPTYAVRMGMTADQSAVLADVLKRCPDDVRDRVMDQLWLKTALIEQMRRMRIDERGPFAVRADRILAALDPPESQPGEDLLPEAAVGPDVTPEAIA